MMDGFALRRTAVAAFTLLALAACGGADGNDEVDQDTDEMRPDTPAAAAMPPAPPAPGMSDTAGADSLSDAQMLSVLDAFNRAEIEPSQMAQSQAQGAQVKEYAQRMITEHTALGDSMRALAQAAGMSPQPHPLAESTNAETQTAAQQLRSQQGAGFDTTYIRVMIQSHEKALATVNERMIPRAQNPQLRAALEQKVRPAVEMHLQQARQLQGGSRSIGFDGRERRPLPNPGAGVFRIAPSSPRHVAARFIAPRGAGLRNGGAMMIRIRRTDRSTAKPTGRHPEARPHLRLIRTTGRRAVRI
jgi:putative membrane protein